MITNLLVSPLPLQLHLQHSFDMSVNQTLLDFRVTPDASGNWMKSVEEKIRGIMKESCQVDKPEFSGPAIMLFSGKHGM